MLFNSLSFALFFPVVTVGYFAIPWRWRWLWLLAASCGFYMAFVPVYILILGATIVVDYFAGLLIASSTGKRRRLWLMASLVANVGTLAVFKYWGFAQANVGALAGLLGVGNPMPALDILLPIGLSFHTFQAMSYTIEVYRGNQAPERHFGIYALYVMFYPQLVAGPIERPQNMLWQFHQEHRFDYARVVSGLQLMALGLFKKVVIADRLAVATEKVWSEPSSYQGWPIAAAILFFSFQIYLDFSAYSEIAQGSARVMGFDLMQNFDAPYFARSIGEFWRRWHISLSTWFRDYVYVPLGGNKLARNALIVFALSGLWHGANWTFVVWGALHGTALLIERALRGKAKAEGQREVAPVWRNVLGTAITFSFVSLAWVFFRAQSLSDAATLLANLARRPMGSVHWVPGVVLVALFVVFEWFHRRRSVFDRLQSAPVWARHLAYATAIYSVVFLSVPHDAQFIYFQF